MGTVDTRGAAVRAGWVHQNVLRPLRRWRATSFPQNLTFLDILKAKHYEAPDPIYHMWSHKSVEEVGRYGLLTDQDIGGCSQASLLYHEDGHMVFEGFLDLRISDEMARQGMVQSGYAAIQTKELDPYLNLTAWDSLQLRIRTVCKWFQCNLGHRAARDDRIYVAQLKVDTSAHDQDIYQAIIPRATGAEVGQWREVALPWNRFVLTFQGYTEEAQRPLEPLCVSHFGILSAQRKEGPFKFEFDWLRAGNSSQMKGARYTIV